MITDKEVWMSAEIFDKIVDWPDLESHDMIFNHGGVSELRNAAKKLCALLMTYANKPASNVCLAELYKQIVIIERHMTYVKASLSTHKNKIAKSEFDNYLETAIKFAVLVQYLDDKFDYRKEL